MNASRYMMRKFRREFAEPCEFWTGEDGMLMSLVIERRPDWADAMKQHYVFHKETFDLSRGKERFVRRENMDADDRENWRDSGSRAMWRCCDEVTPFPVVEYQLEFPR